MGLDTSFTAGITLTSGEVVTLDVTAIDAQGIRCKSDEGERFVPWGEITAVMLATPDHMLENAGYMFSVAEAIRQTDEREAYDAMQMRRVGFALLREAAPRFCPLGTGCPLSADPGARPHPGGGQPQL